MTEGISTLPYRFAPERGTYTCQASQRQTLRQGHGETVPHPTAADTTFNWAVRRGDLLLVSGDFPRFAFVTRRRVARNDPPPLKIGDARLKLETSRDIFRWEDASSITATFHPTHIEHLVRWAELPGVIGHLRVGLTGGSEAVASASIKTQDGATFSGFLELDFGGISAHGRTFSGAYFPPDAADDPRTSFTISEDGGMLTCPDYLEQVAVRFEGSPQLNAANGRLSAKWAVSLAGEGHFASGSTWLLSSGPPPSLPPAPSTVTVAFARMGAEAVALLARSLATTPDPYIGPGFDAAVLTLENCWDFSAWLESTHWWSCYWTNNYQISAAVALGQWDRARRALDFFLDDQGDCPARLADGSRMGDGVRVGRYDALPFWLHQLSAYVDATGDVEFVRKLRPRAEKCIDLMLGARENEPGGLLNWFTGVNCTVYQADHLGWPGEATSPSFLAALALRDWGHLCAAAGDPKTGALWKEKADHLEQLARSRLWDDESGCFFSHRDDEGHTFRNHYYSDHVYPVLYGKILSLPEKAGVLDYLRRELIFETRSKHLLMRVGTYLPSIFSNDNVMPTQMAEAAMAFALLGGNKAAARLLHAVGLAATLDTESPGSFPERLLDHGKGEANYGFGNPAGAYAAAVIHGLFGVALREGGAACQWNPAFPNDWPSAQLHLPWVDLAYSQTATNQQTITRKFDYSSMQSRRLNFRVFLPVADAYHVVVDQAEEKFTLTPGVEGVWLTLAEYPTQKTSIQISFTPHPIKVTGPDVVTAGEAASWQISAEPVALDDPAQSLSGALLDGRTLTGIPRPPVQGVEKHGIIYVTIASPSTVVPISFRSVPLVALASADLVVVDWTSSSASARLRIKFRLAPGVHQSAQLEIDLGGYSTVVPWQGEAEISRDVPAPRSGRLLAAIPLALRVRLKSADGSTFLDQKAVVIPTGSDPAIEAGLRAGRASQAELVSLDDLPQSSTMHVTFPWRYSPKFDLHLRSHAETGFESEGERFSVRADKDSFCLVDGGISDQVTMRAPVPSAVPKSVLIPINRRVCAISLLFASEMEMRVSDARVGEIRLTYAEGMDEVVPLVAGKNFDALRGYSAPECSPIQLNSDGDHLSVLRLPCASTRMLNQITITMQQRDARLALIALHTFGVEE